MVKTFCDICSKEFNDRETRANCKVTLSNNEFSGKYSCFVYSHICLDCFPELNNLFAKFVKARQENKDK